LRHLGESWQDTSLRDGSGSVSKNYFVLHPRQVLQVIDARLQDLPWKDRIANDSGGPRIGAIGPTADASVRAFARSSRSRPRAPMFTAISLARIRLPTLPYSVEDDHFLVQRVHIDRVAQNMPQAQMVRVRLALHFAFMDTPCMALMTPY
jgi:pimeloyl-ACP methyl ester carboxylesterase